MSQPEEELESFRQRWRDEFSAKTRGSTSSRAQRSEDSNPLVPARPPLTALASGSRPGGPSRKRSNPPQSSIKPAHSQNAPDNDWDEYEPRSYHDLEERETGQRLGDSSSSSVAPVPKPASALDDYEEAVAKESIGKLGDSVQLYRTAFRLDAKVQEAYKNKHFPAASYKPPAKPSNVDPSKAPVTVRNTAHASLSGLSKSLSDLVADFSQLNIQGQPPPTEFSPPPPCPIAALPEELLVEILIQLGVMDVASFGRVVQVCKRLAYVVLTEDRIWKRIALGCESGFAAMHYAWGCQLNGKPLGADGRGGRVLTDAAFPPLPTTIEHQRAVGESTNIETVDGDQKPKVQSIYNLYTVPVLSTTTLVPSVYPNHLALFRMRPRLRFGGVYISTVNYTRPGAASPNLITWSSPVHIVTYYRYLRFFRDGSVISLLTTTEPQDVVSHMIPENVRTPHSSGLPQAVMKDALRGRWRLSGPADKAHPTYMARVAAREARARQLAEDDGKLESFADEEVDDSDDEIDENEEEGTVHIETDGVIPKYMYRMALTVGSAGRGTKSNKLAWQGYWSYNKLTDDWAEFGLKNDRPFYWSRVKRFMGA